MGQGRALAQTRPAGRQTRPLNGPAPPVLKPVAHSAGLAHYRAQVRRDQQPWEPSAVPHPGSPAPWVGDRSATPQPPSLMAWTCKWAPRDVSNSSPAGVSPHADTAGSDHL